MSNYNEYSDQEIVALVSWWETSAYSFLVDRYQDKLLKYIIKISNIPIEDAENILQEVFIKSYRYINSYDPQYSFSSWIYRITHNLTIDFYKKNKNTKVVQLEGDEDYGNLTEILSSDEDISINTQKKELKNIIVTILHHLDFKYREVLVLKFLEEKSYEEISDIMQTPTWTVATLINRGKQQFRQYAQDHNIDHYL